MDLDTTDINVDPRGRSRERTPRAPIEDQTPSVSVRRRISTYEKKQEQNQNSHYQQ